MRNGPGAEYFLDGKKAASIAQPHIDDHQVWSASSRGGQLVKAEADQISACSAQQVAAARKQAEILITQSGEWIGERLKVAGAELAASILGHIQREAVRAEQASRVAVHAAWVVAAICVIGLSGLAGFWLSGAIHG